MAELEAFLDKRFKEFEDRACLLLCDISSGLQNRIIKESNITTRHIVQIMHRVSALEAPRDQDQNVQAMPAGSEGMRCFTPRRMGSRSRTQARRAS
jgi:hypothetical protein